MNTSSSYLRFLVIIAAIVPGTLTAQKIPEPPDNQTPPQTVIDVARLYRPTGWMGDGEKGTQFLQIQTASTETPHTPPDCIKITYTLGTAEWAGAYWQNKANNWGDKPGDDFSKKAPRSVTFWARGATGTERIEFKIGDIDSGKKYKDSCMATLGLVSLTREWKRYEIPLSGLDLSSVIGVFCFAIPGNANPQGATFYLDDIFYE